VRVVIIKISCYLFEERLHHHLHGHDSPSWAIAFLGFHDKRLHQVLLILIGTNPLPKPPIRIGITAKKTIINACDVTVIL
jgi:hypothetical protein